MRCVLSLGANRYAIGQPRTEDAEENHERWLDVDGTEHEVRLVVATAERFPNPRPRAAASKNEQLDRGTIVGEYVIDAWAAAGGMATVYAASHPTIGKRAAVKVMSAALITDAVCVERFLQEAQAAGQLSHPNVVEVFGYGELPDGRRYSIMEWLEGETLGRRLSRGGLDLQEGCEILIQVCDALAATHAHGIVHRDLKPENIFLSSVHGGATVVKLLDFGIAKLLTPVGTTETRPRLTAEHSTIGTAEYLSPEQAMGRPILPSSDVYSLGVCAYEMFTGRLPFDAASSVETMYKHIHDPPPPPTSPSGGPLVLPLERLLLALLDKQPAGRPTLAAVREILIELREHGEAAPVIEMTAEPTGSRTMPRVSAVAVVDEAELQPQPATHTMRRPLAPTNGLPRVALVSSAVAAVALAIFLGRSSKTPIAEAAPPTASVAIEAPAPVPVLQAGPGTLLIKTNVTNARIAIDKRVIASAAGSARVLLTDDEVHTLEIDAPGHKPTTQSIAVPAGKTLDVNVRLSRVLRLASASSHLGSGDGMRRKNYIIDSTGKVR